MLRDDLNRILVGLSGGKVRKYLTCLRTPGVKALIVFRFGQWVQTRNILVRYILTPLYYLMRTRVMTRWGIDLPREASVKPGLYIAHFGSIVISPHAIIGKNVDISHDVTIGVAGKGDKRGVPVIGDNVFIGPGVKLLGKIHIGNNVKIGANAVIHKDIPDNAIVVLKPGYEILSYDSQREAEIKHRLNNSE